MSLVEQALTYIDKLCQKIASIKITISRKTTEVKNIEANLKKLEDDNEEIEALINKVQLLNQTLAEKNELLFEKEQEIANLMEAIEVGYSKFKKNKELLENLIK
jgi:hypothetical protein